MYWQQPLGKLVDTVRQGENPGRLRQLPVLICTEVGLIFLQQRYSCVAAQRKLLRTICPSCSFCCNILTFPIHWVHYHLVDYLWSCQISEKNLQKLLAIISRRPHPSVSCANCAHRKIEFDCCLRVLKTFYKFSVYLSISLFCPCNFLWLYEKSSRLGCRTLSLHSILQLGVRQ